MSAQGRSIPGPIVALALAVCLLVVHARIVLGGKTWDDIPYHAQVAPPRLAAAEAAQRGELPGWWEGSGLGVPLLGEPSHGALSPPLWLAHSTRTLDLMMLVHAFWLALGIALLARRFGASDFASLTVGVLALGSGIVASAAIRGALPSLAHLPWVAWAARGLSDRTKRNDGPADPAATDDERAAPWQRAACLALAIGAIGLGGELAVLVDALVIAIVLGARRERAHGTSSTRVPHVVPGPLLLTLGIAAGLAIAALQWIPALFVVGDTAGGTLAALKLSRVLELVVPGCFGGTTGERAVAQIAGEHAAWPSLFIGASVFALATLARAPRRVGGLVIAFAVLAFVVGRGGGWPAWLGAPELHLGALIVIVAALAASGLDVLMLGERRALVALAGACIATGLGVVAIALLRSRVSVDALDDSLRDGVLGLACLVVALVLAWKGRARVAIAALVVAPVVGALGTTAPIIDRSAVDAIPLWVDAARTVPLEGAPARVFRPVSLFDPHADGSVADAVATLHGAVASRFGLVAARSEDPARPALHDSVWLAAAGGGGALLTRYSIALAVLPASVLDAHAEDQRAAATPARDPSSPAPPVSAPPAAELARRGTWSLVRYAAIPAASMVREWLYIADDHAALARLFPPGAKALPTGIVVLHGTGTDHQDEPEPAQPCNITRWTAGAIDLTCVSQGESMAVVSSTPAAGWTVHVAGTDTPWFTADVLRRAVPLPDGAHVVSWRFVPPGILAGAIACAIGSVIVLVLVVLGLRARPATRARTPDPEPLETS